MIDQVSGTGRLAELGRLALEAGSSPIAQDAGALSERVAEGRFYVVSLGQFKRGKSTLLNALIGDAVLPTGVVPVTTVITVIRYGRRPAARVRFETGAAEDIDPARLAAYVSEDCNPGNRRSVAAVELFAPSALLESGMCLVDTPGIGSVFPANTATTRAFMPHIDAALVVLGADPPISGDELSLIEDVSRQTDDLLFVLAKADRLSATERAQGMRFAERMVSERLRRPIGPILEVSAAEELARHDSARDWKALLAKLDALARRSGADLVRGAEERGSAALADRLLQELGSQESAIRRPLEQSRETISLLRRAVGEAEQSLGDLGYLLAGEQERVHSRLDREREEFFRKAVPLALRELRQAIDSEGVTGPELRRSALEAAARVMRQTLDRWRAEQEPRAEAHYREAARRFVDLANGFQEKLESIPGLPRLVPIPYENGFRTKSRLYYTEMLSRAPSSAGKWLLDRALPHSVRGEAIAQDAIAYLERLLEVNSARIRNDFEERVVESRRALERDIRARLREIVGSAERALERARQTQEKGQTAVQAELDRIQRIRERVARLRGGE